MFSSEIQLRVRYAETDQMGYVYYGNYATYFEVARVESLRKLGLNYKDLENSGIMLPVLEYKSKFFKPAKYDDLLTIRVIVKSLPTARIHFEYEVYNEIRDLLTVGETTLVFVSTITKKPCSAPDTFLQTMKKNFQNQQ